MEKEELNLVEILKDAPKGTKLWSPICGECELESVIDSNVHYLIFVRSTSNGRDASFASDGRYTVEWDGECLLFPSKEQRDWSKFEVEKKKKMVAVLRPGSPVLVRDDSDEIWSFNVFSHINDDDDPEPFYVCVFKAWIYCIPYNVDTCHLINTDDPCPIDYEIKFEKEV